MGRRKAVPNHDRDPPGMTYGATTSGRSVRPRSPAEIIEPGRGPTRPKGGRMPRERRAVGSFVRFVSGVLTLLFVVLAASGGTGLYLYDQYEQPGPLADAATVAIPKGEGRIQIARRLESAGVISNRWSFLVSHLMKGLVRGRRKTELKAGEYQFSANASMKTVLETIASGQSIAYKLTIPEGLTSQQVVARINSAEHLAGEITQIPPEGSLMPETYQLAKGSDRNDIVERLQSEQKRFLDAEWEKRAEGLPIATKEEAVILASIVEKETGIKSEREHVASVFINRLRKGMRLQSDPTIIYGLVGGQGSLGRGITKSEKQQKTPYNTYRIDGLPPTPITNPGRKAITAVLNPATTNDYYFVADGTGGHKFSETLKEHNDAVAKWRRIERDAKTRALQSKQAANTRAISIPVPVTTAEGQATAGASGIIVSKTRAISVPAGSAVAAPVEAGATAAGVPLPVRKPKQ